MGEIWGIILAAGESKRMGFPKMLLKFNGSTMIENVIRNVSGSEIKNIMVVLGSNSEILVKLVDDCNVSHCFNEKYKEGMLSSVRCGLRNVPYDFEAVLFFQGDQPLITTEVINIVIAAYRSTGKGIVIPVFEKERGHPVLIDRKYRDEIEKLNDNEGLRLLSYHNPDDVLEIETDEPGILRDFDTYEDYMKLIN